MSHKNFGTVIGFEFSRVLKKKSFWLTTLAVPIVAIVVILMIFISNKTTSDTSDAQEKQQISFEYIDKSGLINPAIAQQLGGTELPRSADAQHERQQVQSGDLEALFVFPEKPASQTTEIYGQDKSVFANSTYQAVATSLLQASASAQVGDQNIAKILEGSTEFHTVTYKDGKEAPGFSAMIIPLALVVVLYVVILMMGSHLLNITVEEKENRVTEMILTTIDATTLIRGKVVAVGVVGLIQIVVFLLIPVISFALFKDDLSKMGIDLSQVTVEPTQLIIGILILLGSIFAFSGALVAAGAMMPSAKESGSIYGALITLLFVPLYMASMLISDPDNIVVRIFTLFPPTSPVAAMTRNAFGNLHMWEAITVIITQFLLGALLMYAAVRIFRYGSISYSSRVKLKQVFGSSSQRKQ